MADKDSDEESAPESESANGNATNPREEEAVIIYEADCDISVRSVKDSVQLIGKLASDIGGYIENNASSDSYRSASMTVRVPVAKFDSFIADLTKIGQVNRKDIKATSLRRLKKFVSGCWRFSKKKSLFLNEYESSAKSIESTRGLNR